MTRIPTRKLPSDLVPPAAVVALPGRLVDRVGRLLVVLVIEVDVFNLISDVVDLAGETALDDDEGGWGSGNGSVVQRYGRTKIPRLG